MNFTALITDPIETYLLWARDNLSVNILFDCLVPKLEYYPDGGLLSAKFSIQTLESIEFHDAVRSASVISLADSGTASGQILGGSSIHDRRIRIISTSTQFMTATFNRDFAMTAIKYGLVNEQIGFKSALWAGKLNELTKTAPAYDKKGNYYQCSGSLLIGLDYG